MGNRTDPQFHPPQPGDGTLPSKHPHRPANSFGPSLEPQEEFLGDHPNRTDAQPLPPPDTKPPPARDANDPGEPV